MSKERPKVVIVSPYPLSRGTPDGVKDYIQTLTPELKKQEIDVVLIGPSIKDEENNFADYTVGRAVRVKMKGTSYRGTTTVNFSRARKIIKSENPDIIEFHNPFSIPPTVETVSLAAREIPQIFHFHAYTEKLTKRQRMLILLAHEIGYVRRVMKRVAERHAVSPDPRRLWAHILKESEALYEIMPNPTDTELYSYKEEKENKEKRLIVCTARHDEHKGIDDLIFAIDRLVRSDIRDFEVAITGQGDKTPQLKGLVKRLGLSEFVKFVGTLPVSDLVDLTSCADVLVAPSKGQEGHNRSITNARAAGTLVVATRVAGQTFAYGPEEVFGEMCEPNNPDDLANRINESLNLPDEEKEKRRELGRRYVEENFSKEVVAKKKVAAYERVIFEKS